MQRENVGQDLAGRNRLVQTVSLYRVVTKQKYLQEQERQSWAREDILSPLTSHHARCRNEAVAKSCLIDSSVW